MKYNRARVAIIGGSGFWPDQSHHKHILELKDCLSVELSAIVDIVDPRTKKMHVNMQKLLAMDNGCLVESKRLFKYR